MDKQKPTAKYTYVLDYCEKTNGYFYLKQKLKL